jgi:hypothetical protein
VSGFTTLANAIKDMRALSSLNLASNDLGSIVGWKYKKCRDPDYWYRHSDGRHQKEKPAEEMGKPEGIIAIANVIPDMGALTKLDISNNSIGAEQEGHLQHICVAGGIELAK